MGIAAVLFLSVHPKPCEAELKKNRTDMKRRKLAPDLQIKDLRITKEGEASDGTHHVRIDVTVANTVRNTSAKNFKVKVEWRWSSTSGRYRLLRQGGVASLGVGQGLSKASATKTLRFSDQIPAGKMKNYRVTVDSMNTVSEMKENNNTRIAEYSNIKPDLVFSRLRVCREEGDITIWPTLLNRSSAPFSGEVRWGIRRDQRYDYQPISLEGHEETGVAGFGFPDFGPRYLTFRLEVLSGTQEQNSRNNDRRIDLSRVPEDGCRTFDYNTGLKNMHKRP
jgi:hypothetical protein